MIFAFMGLVSNCLATLTQIKCLSAIGVNKPVSFFVQSRTLKSRCTATGNIPRQICIFFPAIHWNFPRS